VLRFECDYRQCITGRHHSLSGGSGSLGLTPYFFCLARPHGQPPNVTNISTDWNILAIRFPRLALVQIGHRDSQYSGSKIFEPLPSSTM
jgi:hypothetical protein